ncbi:MAG: hypothetical protein MUO97_11085 [Dehalococcoidia bacterium]|nr:hypothetical protein [Dehalococcoidia bacterium]
MHEKDKLQEARYFYSRMQAEKDPKAFQYNLSAFLSAARSVLQYALEEAKNKKGGQKWYDAHISNRRTLPFFRDQRDINIHTEPVKPGKDYHVTMRSTIHLSSSLSIKHMDESGKILEERHIGNGKLPQEPPKDEATINVRYKFTDWPGDEDVMELSREYLAELKYVVEDGIRCGYLTG